MKHKNSITECLEAYLRAYYGPKVYPYREHSVIDYNRIIDRVGKEADEHGHVPGEYNRIAWNIEGVLSGLLQYKQCPVIDDVHLALQLIREYHSV